MESRQRRWKKGLSTSKHTAARLFAGQRGLGRLLPGHYRGVSSPPGGDRLQLGAEAQLPASHPQVVHTQLLDQSLRNLFYFMFL